MIPVYMLPVLSIAMFPACLLLVLPVLYIYCLVTCMYVPCVLSVLYIVLLPVCTLPMNYLPVISMSHLYVTCSLHVMMYVSRTLCATTCLGIRRYWTVTGTPSVPRVYAALQPT